MNYKNKFLCSLFLFNFDAKRKSGTEKEKHERLNGTSYQGLCPRTPIHNLESLSAQDYDVASYNKLCAEKNNSPRNDNEVCSLPPLWGRVRERGKCHDVTASESEATQSIIGINNITSNEKENNMKTFMVLKIVPSP